MRKTIITHFYNEEYLLPAWLKHHKQIFDHGILIDYHSTDASVKICLDICPEWQVIPSRNAYFDAAAVDAEVMSIERDLEGWRMCLNVTEFLSGDISVMNSQSPSQLLIPGLALVGTQFGEQVILDETFLDQATTGIPYSKVFNLRAARSLHCVPVEYDVGRHFWTYDCEDLCVFWAGYWPWNQQVLDRKYQIQTQIPEHDKQVMRGHHHVKSEQEFQEWWSTDWLPLSENIQPLIARYQQLLRANLHS